MSARKPTMKIEPIAVDVIDVGVRLRPVNDAAVVVLRRKHATARPA